MRKVAAIVGSLLGLTCTVGHAADLPIKGPAYVTPLAHNWSGFYIQGDIGYMWGRGESSTVGDPVVNMNGVMLGFGIGYDVQLANNWVLGAFVTAPIPLMNNSYNPVPGLSISTDINWAVVVAGRLGYAMGRWMPYGFAGLVIGEGETNSAAFPAVNQTRTHTGFTVGLGLDYALTQNWIVGTRYAYVDMGRETYTGYFPARSIGFSGHQAAFNIRYKW